MPNGSLNRPASKESGNRSGTFPELRSTRAVEKAAARHKRVSPATIPNTPPGTYGSFVMTAFRASVRAGGFRTLMNDFRAVLERTLSTQPNGRTLEAGEEGE